MISIRGTVTGHVQGVFFRASTCETATSLNITGWVKNLPDGRVEFLACGEEDQINKLCEWLKHGPAHAEVESMQYKEIPFEEHAHFKCD